ncbi:MAG TPA: PAS domain S-box protein, partial [Pyrinomonadaceae bacterium]|nr:PAS domain S-box protein [Pyrinomonadaceae bacterium]
MKPRGANILVRYGLAVVLLGLIVAVQAFLLRYSIKISFAVPITLGLVLTTWYGGFGPGLLLSFLVAIVSAASTWDQPGLSGVEWTVAHLSTFGVLVLLAWMIRERRVASGKISDSEARARETEEQFRSFFELGGMGMAIISTDSHFIAVNDALCDLLGYKRSELLEMSWVEVTPEGERDVAKERFASVIAGDVPGYFLERQIVRKGGDIHYATVSLKGVKNADGKPQYVIAVVQDVTSRTFAEQALRTSEERYRDLIENAHDIIYTHDLEGNCLSVNAAVERVIGYTPEEALNLNIKDAVLPHEVHRVEDMIRRKINGETVTSYELEMRAKDGRTVTVDVNTRIIYRDHKPVAVQGIARDITGRKRLEEQLLQAQKLESIGRLAGGIAHDFNNMLTAINGYSDLALRRMHEDEPVRTYIEEIKKAGERSALLTSQLLAFSRRQILHPEMIRLNDVIDDTTNLLQRLIGEDIELVTRCKPSVGAIKFDPGQLSQILMNLAVNARDAMPNGGKVTIETSNVFVDPDLASGHVGLLPGPYVLLSVSDTGTGISPDIQEQIFEPFFTTKPVGKGTGLGLATVYGIVRQSGGRIFVYSEEGHGTTFKIYIPRVAEGPVETHTPTTAERLLAVGTETILLAEDEQLVRALSRQVLESCGYRVIEAKDGVEAYDILRNGSDDIELLITDVIMPRMGGRELAERLRETRPDLPILFASGYTDEAVVRHGMLDDGMNFIQKPFTIDDV